MVHVAAIGVINTIRSQHLFPLTQLTRCANKSSEEGDESNRSPMADHGARDRSTRSTRLTCAFDAGFLPGALPPDSPNSSDLEDDDSYLETSSDSDSPSELNAILRTVTESMLRMEAAEMEMMKAREVSRLEAERRRLESEKEMTRLVMETQLQIAKGVEELSQNRKRKRVEEEEEDQDDSSITQRQSLLLLALLKCNMSFWM